MSVLLARQPTWIQTKGYSARDDRSSQRVSRAGIITGLGVSAGSGMNATVAPGAAVIAGTRNPGQGHYIEAIDSTITVPWPSASATIRTDILYMQVVDNAEIMLAGGSLASQEGVILDVLLGGGTLPADAVAICTVTVPANAVNLSGATFKAASYCGPRTGQELVTATYGVNVGPTGVSTTAPGDSLLDLGLLTTRNIQHWFELFWCFQASIVGGSLAINLYEGTPGAPGVPVAAIAAFPQVVNVPFVVMGKFPFTPAAGTRNYHLRWRSSNAATWTIQHSSLMNGMLSIREAALGGP